MQRGEHFGGSRESRVRPFAEQAPAMHDAGAGIVLPTTYAPSPFRLNWTDRRPIGQVFLAPVSGKGASEDGYGPQNPRGWTK